MERTRPGVQLSPEQAADLIREATEITLAKKPADQSLGYEDVVAMAKELGVDEASVQRALESREAKEKERQAREAEAEKRKAKLGRALAQVSGHATSYVFTVGGLAVLDYLTGPGWWVQWVAMGWGIGLAAHVLGVVRRALVDSFRK